MIINTTKRSDRKFYVTRKMCLILSFFFSLSIPLPLSPSLSSSQSPAVRVNHTVTLITLSVYYVLSLPALYTHTHSNTHPNTHPHTHKHLSHSLLIANREGSWGDGRGGLVVTL